MRQTELRLKKGDRARVEEIRSKGCHHSREVNRAHILSGLDRGIPESQLMAVLGVGRTALWRTRAAYRRGGLDLALSDIARPGRPRQYDTAVEARITALACAAPPAGRRRWTLLELERAARDDTGHTDLSRETVRRMLKKTTSNLGAA
jgi:hypothetical protein